MSNYEQNLNIFQGHSLIRTQGKAGKIFLTIFLVIVVAIILTFMMMQNVSDVATNQLQAIKAGDVTKAYASTSAAFQQQASLSQFEKFVGQYPILKDFKNITINEKKVEGNFAYLSGELENINGVKSAIEFQLIKENNQWKIQAMRLAYVKSADSILTPGKAVDNSGASIKGILVSNEADAQGYVSKSKTQIPGSAQKIFATVQLVAPNAGIKIKSSLINIGNGQQIGPSFGEITKSGSIMKAFSFTRGKENWPKGDYAIVVNLSTGASKTIKFSVE